VCVCVMVWVCAFVWVGVHVGGWVCLCGWVWASLSFIPFGQCPCSPVYPSAPQPVRSTCMPQIPTRVLVAVCCAGARACVVHACHTASALQSAHAGARTEIRACALTSTTCAPSSALCLCSSSIPQPTSSALCLCSSIPQPTSSALCLCSSIPQPTAATVFDWVRSPPMCCVCFRARICVSLAVPALLRYAAWLQAQGQGQVPGGIESAGSRLGERHQAIAALQVCVCGKERGGCQGWVNVTR